MMKVRACVISLMGVLLMLFLRPHEITGANTALNPAPSPLTWATPVSQKPVLRMRVGTFDPLTTLPALPLRVSQEPGLQIIQFKGPVQDTWIATMAEAELETVTYIPDYAYLVWGTADQMTQVSTAAPVRWSGAYPAAFTLHPDFQYRVTTQHEASEMVEVAVQLYDHAGADDVLARLRASATDILRPPMRVKRTLVIGLQVPTNALKTLMTLPGIISIDPLARPERLDEIQGQILAGNVGATGSWPASPGYLHWLTATVGLPTHPAAYPIVDITDDGIDNGNDTPAHPDFYIKGDTSQPDRLAYNANWTPEATADGAGGHGNLNASIVGGYNTHTGWPHEDTEGYNYGLGINPFGPIAGSKVFDNTGAWAFPNFGQIAAYAYTRGARIVSNSWGNMSTPGAYTIDDQIYDGLVRDADATQPGAQALTFIFAVGNAGPVSGQTGSPGNAKNVITVGASESYRPSCVCGVTEDADNANTIIWFSSRGPTADGRTKPDLVAPGTRIMGAASQTSSYIGNGVCTPYYPDRQTLYTVSSGTSHATPAVAGAASLLTRFYQDRFQSYPSPAMLKAYLVNSARHLGGTSGEDTLPSMSQGYGLTDLGRAFDDTARIVHDQTLRFEATGDTLVVTGSVAHAGRPFRVTLVWTDAPGSTIAASYVNNLDLTVRVGEQTYLGNMFSGGSSVTGGSADFRNNVESVFLPAGLRGSFTITVTATNLAGDGVPENEDPTDQDFALICYNCMVPRHTIFLPICVEP